LQWQLSTQSGHDRFRPIAVIKRMGERKAMNGATIIGWIDRQYDSYPKAKYAWASLVILPWLLVLLLDWHPAPIAVASLWSIFWTALYAWRAAIWIQKLDKRWERRRKR
jgi:hypothetical protein